MSVEGKDKAQSNVHLKKIAVIAALGVIAVLVLTYLFVPQITGNKDSTLSAGEFGDMFGASNALFSGLAFVGVIIAILLQSQELKLQRKELIETREVLLDQKKALNDQKKQMELQNQAMLKQQFENTFFQMIGLYNEIIHKIRMPTQDGHPNEGRHVIQKYFVIQFKNTVKKSLGEHGKGEKEYLFKNFKLFNEKNNHILGHYYRTIHSILEFIEDSNVENPEFYSGILRSQLSRYELAILAFNCISDETYKSFLLRMKRFNMFKHIVPEDMMTEELLSTLEIR